MDFDAAQRHARNAAAETEPGEHCPHHTVLSPHRAGERRRLAAVSGQHHVAVSALERSTLRVFGVKGAIVSEFGTEKSTP